MFWNKHTGTVFTYTYTCMYVNFFCQMQKGQQDQVIYIFDKNIKTYLREVEKAVFYYAGAAEISEENEKRHCGRDCFHTAAN